MGSRLWVKKIRDGHLEPLLDRAGQPVSVAFTEADADQAMIWEKGKQIPLSQKWNFVSWARDMYYWKATEAGSPLLPALTHVPARRNDARKRWK